MSTVTRRCFLIGGSGVAAGASLFVLTRSTPIAPIAVASGQGFYLDGDGDSTVALQELIASAQALGVRHVRGVPGSTYAIALAQGETLGTITLDGMLLDFTGCTIDNSVVSYTADAITPWFDIDGARDVTIKLGTGLGYELPAPSSHLGYRGATFVNARNGARGITVECLDLHHFRYGVRSGDYGDPTEGGCSGFNLRLAGTMVGYPVATYLADNIHFDLDFDGVHRVFYWGGGDGCWGTARVKNQYIADTLFTVTDSLLSGSDTAAQLDPVGAATSSRGCKNAEVVIIDKGSNVEEPSSCLSGITLSRVDPCEFCNIRIVVYSKGNDRISRRMGGFRIVSGAKSIWNRYNYNWEPHVVFDNIEISGVIDKSAVTLSGNSGSEFYVMTFEESSAHAATIRGFRVRNFTFRPPSKNLNDSYFHAPGLASPAVFDSFNTPGVALNFFTNGNVPTNFKATTLAELKDVGTPGGSLIHVLDGTLSIKRTASE